MSQTGPIGVEIDNINGTATPPSVEMLNAYDGYGWFYTPTQSYVLSGIGTDFAPISNAPDPNLQGDRTITVQIQSDTPANGGTILAQGTFDGNGVTGGALGANFSPITLQAGETYFVDFLNIVGMGVNLGQYTVDQSGSHVASNGATTRLAADYADNYDGQFGTLQPAGADDFSSAQTGAGDVSWVEPILRFYSPGAIPIVNTPTPVALGNVRSGAAGETLGISNGPTASFPLDVSIGSVSGDATGAGTITALAVGGTNTTAITVGLGSAGVGTQSGTVTLAFSSDSGTAAAAALPTVPIAVSGTVYREAAPSVAPISETLHIGDTGTVALSVANTDAADGFSENLIASLAAVSGGITISAGGPTGEIVAGGSDSTSLLLGFSTAQAGVISGTGTLDVTSDGGTGAGSIDGLGTTALAPVTVPVSITVDNDASPEFEVVSDGGTGATISTSGTSSVLNLGTIAQGSGPLTIGLGVENSAIGPADLLSGSFQTAGSSAFTTSGFDAFSGKGAGQADTAPAVTLDTSTDGTFTETVTLTPSGSNASGYSAALPDETLTIEGTVAPLAPPVITAPASETVFDDMATVLGPISIADPDAGNGNLSILLTAGAGTLSANPSGSATVTGNGTNRLTLTGDISDLLAVLAAVIYDGTAIGADTVTIAVTDAHHAMASQSVAIAINPMPFTAPVLNVPTSETVLPGTASALGGISVSDPSAAATSTELTVSLLGASGSTFTATGSGGAVIGQGTNILSITSTVQGINSYFADAGEAIAVESEEVGLLVSNASGSVIKTLGQQELEQLAVIEDQEGYEAAEAWFQTQQAVYENQGLLATLEFTYQVAIGKFVIAALAGAVVAHLFGLSVISAADGLLFPSNASGEFLLALSTQPSDSFQVQTRLQAYNNSSSASAITQIAALVGSDDVTIGVIGNGQTAPVMVNGSPVTPTQNTPITLSGGQLTEVSAGTYEIAWNTGETLTVTDYGSYLDLQVGIPSEDPPGSIVGLMGPNGEPAADTFTLPDGTVLQQPLTANELYQTFAQAWLVPEGFSLFNYGPGQSSATFDNANFPTAQITLADLPANIVAAAAVVVAAAGITDPNAVAAAEFDYIVSGGNSGIVASDAAALQGLTTEQATITPSGPAPAAIGVFSLAQQQVGAAEDVIFTVYLTGTTDVATIVDWDLNAPDLTFIPATALGTAPTSGQVTIAAGQTIATFTIDVPLSAFGTLPSENLGVTVSSPDDVPLFAPTAQTTIVNPPTKGPAPKPELADLTNFGTWKQDGDNYTLNLGALELGQYLPTLQFAIINAATLGADQIGGTFTVASVAGYTVTGASLPEPIDAGQDYEGLTVTPNEEKINSQSTETITFTPTDTNPTGYSAPLSPLTLTIEDTIVPPTMYYSTAWGDVHILTYNGTGYDFQAEGEFTLAKSSLPNDTFDIQLRLSPWTYGLAFGNAALTYVSVITQVAVSVGTDRVTFDPTRPDLVQVNGIASTISLSDPSVTLSGGKLVEISPTQFQVVWNTGEEMTVTDNGGYLNVTDGIPLAELGNVAGLQGEGEGAANDFQLPDGTVLQQPLTSAQLYGEYANGWRVTQASSLFDYPAGKTTASYTDLNYPTQEITALDLAESTQAAAKKLVTAAGITDTGIAQDAEYDYLATGDPSFITAAANVAQQGFVSQAATITPTTPNPLLQVMPASPGYVESATGTTAVTFDVTLSQSVLVDTPVTYTVVDEGAGSLGTSVFGTILPSGTITLQALQTSGTFTIDVPQGALGTTPGENLDVQIASPTGTTVFTPVAQARVTNYQAEPGSPPIPMLAELSGGGTLVFDSTTDTYTLNLGTVTPAAVATPVQFAIVNAATGTADDLSGTFTAPLGSGFIVTGNALTGAIAAGDSYEGLYASPELNAYGANSETLTFKPLDTNDSGYSAILPTMTLTVKDTVESPAQAVVNTPTTILFPSARIGATDTQMVSITNSAAAPAASLNVTPSASGAATASGSITGLAPGATDATDVSVGLNTGTAGADSGAVALGLGSQAGTGAASPLMTDTNIDVFGSVFREAAASIDPIDEIVHAGDPGVAPLSVTNTDTADGYSEDLSATLASTSGDIGIAPGDPPVEIAPGATNDVALAISFATAQAGTVTGTANVSLASDGGTGSGSIDGLGEVALPSEAVPVDIAVNNYATLAVTSDGNLRRNSDGSYTLDLGTATVGAAALSAGLTVLNNAIGPADWLSGSYSVSGDPAYDNSGFDAFSELGAGVSADAGTVSLSTAQAGTFDETIDLSATDGNASGFSEDVSDPTIDVIGTIAAAASSGAPSSGGNGTTGTTGVGSSGTGSSGGSETTGTTGAGSSGTGSSGGSETTGVGSNGATPAGGGTGPAGAATGDVHMVSFDGLHYDFQAVGTFLLARSTVPGNAFRIEIQTGALPGIAGVSYNTEIAAGLGDGERVTFEAGRGAVVWVDGKPDTALSMSDPTRFADGSILVQTSPDRYSLIWRTGEVLTVTDRGRYLDLSTALGPSDGPGSVQGLLGTDRGQSTDFALPDGVVLGQTLSAVELYGTFANAWRVDYAGSLLDDDAAPTAASQAATPGVVSGGLSGQDAGDPATIQVATGGSLVNTTPQFIASASGGGTAAIANTDSTSSLLNGTGAAALGFPNQSGLLLQNGLSGQSNDLLPFAPGSSRSFTAIDPVPAVGSAGAMLSSTNHFVAAAGPPFDAIA